MKKDKSLLQTALESLIADGNIEGPLRAYSGRGMYGAECLAFVPESPTSPLELGVLLAHATVKSERCHCDEDLVDSALVELAEQAGGFRQDQLGKGVIYYWPHVPYVAPEGEPA